MELAKDSELCFFFQLYYLKKFFTINIFVLQKQQKYIFKLF